MEGVRVEGGGSSEHLPHSMPAAVQVGYGRGQGQGASGGGGVWSIGRGRMWHLVTRRHQQVCYATEHVHVYQLLLQAIMYQREIPHADVPPWERSGDAGGCRQA
jgi:hypothetical protein